MADVTLSSKNQIVIPREAREKLGLRAGTRLGVVVRGEMMILLRKPEKYADAIAGIGAGLYGPNYRDGERRSWR